ncbi:MAG: hypothetical protein IPM24_03620 [Bryobacterales bacterium]|nr:hypothetical protein [Bryobacterales bacterium]
MFEFLFQHPSTLFAKGQFTLLSPWPVWVLVLLVLSAAGGLVWYALRSRGVLPKPRALVVGALQAAMAAILLLLLWRPAISVTTLRSQQNVIAILLDDSQSMGTDEGGARRIEQAVRGLEGGVLDRLRDRFQIRLYRFGGGLERLEKLEEASATASASRLGAALRETLAETATLPLGAIVALTDGADTSSGIDRETIAQIRGRKIPVHTVGYGREVISPDLEITDVVVPPRTLADSRLSAEVVFRQNGLAGKKTKLTIREGGQRGGPDGKVASGRILLTREVTLKADGQPQAETISFQAGSAGAKSFHFSFDPVPGERNELNNSLQRLVNVEGEKPRILYFEGEPRWEFKFIRRAIDEDRGIQLVTILRTTQNKIYRQGILDPTELEAGFPARAEDLFQYSGLIFGSVDAAAFSPEQQELIREFANRRGGGVLFLGGRSALSDGGWDASALAELLPVRLADRTGTFHREQATLELTPQGREHLITRLLEDPIRNAERWKQMPALADYQETGPPKPGALVLAEVAAQGRRQPLLAVQRYGRGRTALFATGGSWRWQMSQDLADRTHEDFWQQLLRWLVAETPGQVNGTTPRPVLSDESVVRLRAEVRDKEYSAVSDARVEARIVGPGGVAASIDLAPDPMEDGIYLGEWAADPTGAYVAEVLVRRGEEDAGRDVVMFHREDGVAEHFRVEQNKELLRNLSEQTGGRYYEADEIGRLPDDIEFSEAGLTARQTLDLWNMPAVFLLLLALRGAEWFVRRRWGVI